jgi:hypothetical protein
MPGAGAVCQRIVAQRILRPSVYPIGEQMSDPDAGWTERPRYPMRLAIHAIRISVVQLGSERRRYVKLAAVSQIILIGVS